MSCPVSVPSQWGGWGGNYCKQELDITVEFSFANISGGLLKPLGFSEEAGPSPSKPGLGAAKASSPPRVLVSYPIVFLQLSRSIMFQN